MTLRGVIVTGGPSVSGDSFFVQDVGGGLWSGVRVYTNAWVAPVREGDVVTVTGTILEYYDETELEVARSADITVTGSATPSVVELASAPPDWEPYEGVLVRLNTVSLTSAADSAGESTTSWPILMDDFLYDYDTFYSNGTRFRSAAGLVRYSFEAWKLEPRDAGDLLF